MLNQCNFIGRCGSDPEVKTLQSGKSVANVSIACSEKYGKGEDKKEVTEWVKLIFWEKLAEIVGSYVHKGSMLFVSGKMQTRSWENKDGVKQYTTEIVVNQMKMLDSKRDGGGGGSDAPPKESDAPKEPIPQDDIPF